MNERFSIIPAVWVIVKNDQNQVFLLRRANTGWRDGWWTVPAGHVEKNEGPAAAAVRELKEEVGLSVESKELSNPSVYFYPADEMNHERVSIFFTLNDYKGNPVNAEPEKADRAQWFDMDDLPENIPPLLRRAFTDIAEGIHYSERYYDPNHLKELLQ
jgi:8-oxo-dGTP diphosphatase